MSEIHTLKQINLDAARYRWLRDQTVSTRIEMYGAIISHPGLSGVTLDAMVDSEIDFAESCRGLSLDD